MFAASGDGVAFTTILPDGSGQQVDASLQVDDKHRLVLVWTSRAARSGGGRRVLAEGVATLALEYRASGTTDAWQPSWNGPGLPGLVRLSVAWTDHARRRWPPIIVAPTLNFPRD